MRERRRKNSRRQEQSSYLPAWLRIPSKNQDCEKCSSFEIRTDTRLKSQPNKISESFEREQPMNAEEKRLEESRDRKSHCKRWGRYLSERQWGTVREDYNEHGTAWDFFPHDHARSRTYRWGEDGIMGISDRRQLVCFALAMWNGKDPILKERLFGLTGPEGNHGEDVKECYFYLDSTPTHSYMKGLYKYPQAEFPYARLVEENARRARAHPEFELMEAGVFAKDRYFDVFAEYAKVTTDDILIRLTVVNRGSEPATLHLLPTLWFRNMWTWEVDAERPTLRRGGRASGRMFIRADHRGLGRTYRLYCEAEPELLFTDNEMNFRRLWGVENTHLYVKAAFHDYVVHGLKIAVNPAFEGTKAAAYYRLDLAAGESAAVRLRLSDREPEGDPFGDAFDRLFAQRQREADEFYGTVIPSKLSEDAQNVMRQALAGMLWSKQWYHYDVRRWLEGDPTPPAPP